MAPAVSRDGRFVYCTKSDLASGIWRVPVEGGEETEVLEEPVASANGDWALGRSGLYHAVRELPRVRDPEYTILHLDLTSGQETELFHGEGQLFRTDLAISPDEE